MKRSISIKAALEIAYAGYLILLTAGFLHVGGGVLFNAETWLMGMSLGLMMLFLLRNSGEQYFPLIAMLAATFLPAIFFRILMYVWLPELVAFPFGEDIDVVDVNAGIFYILVGSACLLLGAWCCKSLLQRAEIKWHNSATPVLAASWRLLFAILLLTLAVAFSISNFFEISPYGVDHRLTSATWNTLLQFVIAALDSDMALLVIFVILISRGAPLGGWGWFMLGLCVILYWASAAYGGSRSSGLRLTFMLLAVFLSMRGNIRIQASYLVTFLIFMSVMSWLTYPIATMRRAELLHNSIAEMPLSETSIGNLVAGGRLGKLIAAARKATVQISNRLGVIDYGILIVTQQANPAAKDRYANISYITKSVINTVPGVVYPEAQLNTSRAVTVLYRGEKEGRLLGGKMSMFSEFYTIWGVAFLFVGWWGGLAAMFVSGFAFILCYLISRKVGGVYQPYIGALFLFIAPSALFFTMGVDHSLQLVGIEIFRLAIILAIIKYVHTAFPSACSAKNAEI